MRTPVYDGDIMRVTQQDIAARLGMDRSTVSRALRQDPRIPAATRQRVQAVCQELDYRPSSILSELAAARWQVNKVNAGTVIAYINCFRPGAPVWVNMVEVLRRRAAVLGYEVEAFSRAEIGSSAKLQRALRSRGITDVIIGPQQEEYFAIELDWEKFTCIQLLPGFFPLPLHSVVRDHFNSVLLAWNKAVSHGYRRIGVTLLDHPFPLSDDVMRASAVTACQNQLFPDLPVIPPFHYPGGDLRERDFVQWARTHQPDVILGFNVAHYWLYVAEFGRDMPYATLNADKRFPTVSGVPDDHDIVAVEGINLLHYCRRSYQWGIPAQRIDHVIEPTWYEGTTMPNKRLSPA